MVEAKWTLASTPAGLVSAPDALDGVEWLPAVVPGTAASSLGVGLDDQRDFDADDWWWRASVDVDGDGPWFLRVGGIATVADVWLDGRHVHHGESMFLSSVVPVGELAGGPHELVVRCAALGPLLAARHPRPRWRTRLVASQSLRWFRTTLLGRIPGWAATCAAVGPWRGVELVAGPVLVDRRVRASADGVVRVTASVAGADGEARLSVGDASVDVEVVDGSVTAEVRLDSYERWWPHTHGPQPRYPVTLSIGGVDIDLGSVGFRTIEARTDDGGFTLSVNGVRVFCRGACWVPIDPVGFNATPDEQRAALEDVRRAGMNMVRVGGTMVYEDDAFHDLCDELGILVWQDVMWANMDPPDDEAFVEGVQAEVEQLLGRIGGRPSTAVLCGGSEVEQQAAMMGLPADRRAMPLFDEVLPALVGDDHVWVPSTPTGGGFPFSADTGVSHYFGVSAYRRPLEDARRAGVRFAAECLAFANVPDPLPFDLDSGPRWKGGVPRDNAAPWDFEDVRDHYVGDLFDVDPAALRASDPSRYLDLGRMAAGEAMAATYAEWRRPGSSCAGGLIWTLRDLRPGAGWGVVDSAGRPKPVWWYVRRALAPLALLLTDEGLNGLHAHLVNDRAEPFEGRLVVELFARGELRVEAAERELQLAGHDGATVVVDGLLDGFRDLTWAYRFGPPAADVVSLSLLDGAGVTVASAVHLPAGRGRPVEADLGLTATLVDGAVRVTTRRFAQAVVVDAGTWRPDDNWFPLAPGAERVVALSGGTGSPTGRVRAVNAVVGASFA